MSKLYDLRAALKSGIVAENMGLVDEDIIIERQADIFREIETTVSNASNGVSLVISSPLKKNLAVRAKKPRWQVTLKLTLWLQPLLAAGNLPEEDITEKLENYLSALQLDPASPSACQREVQVLSCDDLPDNDYLVRELTIQMILQN